MVDIIAGIVILLIVAVAGAYIYKAKKKGAKCIGCPQGCNCERVGNAQDSKNLECCK